MIKVNTSDLMGVALDWAVARADGYAWQLERGAYGSGFHVVVKLPEPSVDRQVAFRPSSDWGHGGPLIEKYGIKLERMRNGSSWFAGWMYSSQGWNARYEMLDGEKKGGESSPLIAACRAIVAAKLGDKIEVPAELMEQSDAAS